MQFLSHATPELLGLLDRFAVEPLILFGRADPRLCSERRRRGEEPVFLQCRLNSGSLCHKQIPLSNASG
jgi:hypothetical protein